MIGQQKEAPEGGWGEMRGRSDRAEVEWVWGGGLLLCSPLRSREAIVDLRGNTISCSERVLPFPDKHIGHHQGSLREDAAEGDAACSGRKERVGLSQGDLGISSRKGACAGDTFGSSDLPGLVGIDFFLTALALTSLQRGHRLSTAPLA